MRPPLTKSIASWMERLESERKDLLKELDTQQTEILTTDVMVVEPLQENVQRIEQIDALLDGTYANNQFRW